ncbi:unnamed protein product [Effrenium voratum]|uniref:Uncharacterized protein n=1 Tax=Effrenium voratum TaxID=2562239 RepID=A0AA36JLH7_9DINO|nr:unnamed protein product [Effrenium voratum]
MSDTSWGCQSVEECAVPTWDHATGQLLVAGTMWSLFVLCGILWTWLAPFINFDFRGTFGRYQHGLASAGVGAGICLTGIYILQCITFMHRSIVGFVDPLLHAFEMLGTLISLLDVGARWAYMCCDGFWQLMLHSFNGNLFVDCVVSTSTVGLGIVAGPPGEEKRTWWSLAFLASIHVFRCLKCLARADTGKGDGNSKRQILYASVMVFTSGFLFAAIIMTLEILGPRPGSDAEDKLPGSEVPWTMSDGLAWSLSLFTFLGNSGRMPSSNFGQVVCLIGLGIASYQVVRITPVAISAVTGTGSFVGRYPIESRLGRHQEGHTIITGSPTARTVIDFLFEYFHPNHFAGGLDFEREAKDVVVFLDDERILAHLSRMLDLKDASMFRSRVFLIKGTTFQPYDCRRAGTSYAHRAVILPNLQTCDVDRDDQTNIMRTYAICAAGPNVKATCLLHSAQHQGSVLSGSTPNSYFVSVDAIKMGLMGKACMFPGAITMICNLCTSVGEGTDMYSVRRHWLTDYESGLDMELYEVPLSMGYTGYTFLDAFEDVVARSKGSVMIIGITDIGRLNSQRGRKEGEREILINPGPDYELKVVEGRTAGVFIASELESIKQVSPGEEPKITRAKMPKKLPIFEKTMQKAVAGKKRTKDDSLRQLADTTQSGNASPDAKITDEKGTLEQAREMKKDIDMQYEHIMLMLKKKQGLPPDLVGGATHTPAFQRRFARSTLSQVREEDSGSEDEDDKSWVQKIAGEAIDKYEKKKQELEKLEALLERCRRDAMGERKLPKALINSGGHVLVLLVGDTEVSSVSVGSSKLIGAPVGIDNFMKALRDDRLELNQGSQPTVLFLGELQPSDWHKICHLERVFYLAGSPLRTEDLYRAGIKTCSAVVVARMHSGVVGQKVMKIADARVVLAATMAAYSLPSDKVLPIVTDHAYAGSCDLLPPERVFIEEGPPVNTSMVGPPPLLPQALTALLGGAKALTRSIGLDGKPPPVIDVASLDGGTFSEKYEDMETRDIKYHPRYLRGQVFFSAAATTMVASSMYNPNLITLIDALIEAPMFMIDVPKVFYQSRYQDLAIWLLRDRGLLALALYRSAEASQSAHTGDFLDQATPTHDFVYTCPDGSKTVVVKSDRIIVTSIGVAMTKPTEMGTQGMKNKMKKALENIYGTMDAAAKA